MRSAEHGAVRTALDRISMRVCLEQPLPLVALLYVTCFCLCALLGFIDLTYSAHRCASLLISHTLAGNLFMHAALALLLRLISSQSDLLVASLLLCFTIFSAYGESILNKAEKTRQNIADILRK